MKIAVVFTGGTIGSKVEHGVIAPQGNIPYRLLTYMPDSVKADTFEPFTTLSEYMTGEHLNSLFDCVREILKKDYDGIIITHGTDSLQFSAAALGYVFADSKIPIVLVSSKYVLDNPENNGERNFLDAIQFIKEKLGSGVFVCYENNDKRRFVHRGVRLLSAIPYSDDILSVCNSYYGEFTDNGFMRNDNNKSFESIGEVTLSKYSESILCVDAKTGLNITEIPESTKAILHSTYHSGTLNTKNETLFNLAKERNIPIFLTGSGNDVDYESATVFNELGLIALPKISPLCAYIKLWLIIDSGLEVSLLFKNYGDIIGG